ncbi:MAG TPA: pitrilysin family protein, partial [Candidatus Polarisedimenticolia bacterium]|nr:pitrilysin family protein [Candidatus Polarisedimenticolia bacterium]
MSGTGHASARTVALSAALALAALAAPDAFARAKADRIPPSSRLVLDNGFEAILIPNRAVPLVTSVVVVRAGLERETPQTNGISHMLEHLLFNGTARRTQEQIAAEQARYGIINNAHTGTTHTDFFVMASREEFHRALDLQADMLFNSTIPDAILEKERGIVLNEIARDRAAHHTAVAELFAEVLYHPGPLAMPALGTPESIEAMPRAAIVGYYTRWYVPNNMTAILMGDFDPEEMAPLVRHAFGGAAPGPLVAAPANPIDPTALGRTHDRRVEAGGRTLRLGAPAPGIGEAAFGTAWLLAGLLDHQLAPAANRRLPADAGGAILSAGVSLETHGAAAAFVVEAELDASLDWNQAASAVRSEIAARLGQADWKTDELDRVRIAEKASMLRLWEKPHYFGLDRAPLIAAGGWEYTRDFLRHLDWVEPSDLKDLARPLSAESSWATFRVGPDAPALQGADARPPAPAAEAQPSRPTRESRALVDAWKPARPAGDSTPPALARRTGATPDRINVLRVLPNGLTLSLDVSDESRVFAASVLALNRAAAEPAGRTGIADMLHRLAGEATRS